METTIMGYIRVILGLFRENGKENGNYYSGFKGPHIGGCVSVSLTEHW